MANTKNQSPTVQRLEYSPANAGLDKAGIRAKIRECVQHYGATPTGHPEHNAVFLQAVYLDHVLSGAANEEPVPKPTAKAKK